jgi:hypothetical protein
VLLGLSYKQDASAFSSSPFDFVATGLRTIQFLFSSNLGPRVLALNGLQTRCDETILVFLGQNTLNEGGY